MVDGVRGDAGKIGHLPMSEGAEGAAAAHSAKQTPAGALSLPSFSLASVEESLVGMRAPDQAAARAQGAPVPLSAPAPGAMSSARVMQVMTSIAGGGEEGGAAVPVTDISQLMLMMAEVSRGLRDTAMKQRSMAQEANVASQTAAIASMREAAGQRFAAAIIESTTQLVLGVVSLAQAAATAKAAGAAESASNKYSAANKQFKGEVETPAGAAAPTKTDVYDLKTQATAAQARVAALGERNETIQKVGGAIGKAASAVVTARADEASVMQRQYELDASRHDAGANAAADMANTMRDRANETLQTLRSIHQSLADASSAINRNM